MSIKKEKYSVNGYMLKQYRYSHYMLMLSLIWLCDPMDSSLSGSFIPEIPQARIPEWFAISYSRGSSQPRDQTRISWVSCIGSL